MTIHLVGAELFYADGRTDLTKLIVAFRNFANATNVALRPILNLSGGGGIYEDDGRPQDSRCFDRGTNRGIHDANPFSVAVVVTSERQREHRLVGFRPSYFCGFSHLMQNVTDSSFQTG